MSQHQDSTEFTRQRRRVLSASASVAISSGLAGWGTHARAAAPSPAPGDRPGDRVALVIGNDRYVEAGLANAGNDASLVASTLIGLGFKVALRKDLGNAEMLEAVKSWLAASANASARLLYFAGHGAQYRDRNFLIPVDARLRSEDDLPGSAFSVNDLSDRLSRMQDSVSIVVLDACRSIPAVTTAPGTRMRGAPATPWTPGLSANTGPCGTLIAYSTSPGAVAADSPGARNSLYTRSFVSQLSVPGLPVEAVFKRTRAAVLQASRGTQLPWEASSLVGDFCFTFKSTSL